MRIDIISIFLICIFTALAWWALHKFADKLPPIVVTILEIIVVVVSVFSVLGACGIGAGIHINI